MIARRIITGGRRPGKTYASARLCAGLWDKAARDFAAGRLAVDPQSRTGQALQIEAAARGLKRNA